MIILGLSGSIGMGKSTTAAMLRRRGCPVHDADRCVRRLLGTGSVACQVAARFPDALRDGRIDRQALGARVFGDAAALRALEAILHPLVAMARGRFLRRAAAARARLVVLDVPLLFETGGDAACDLTLLVTAPPFVQRARVLRRPGMTADRLADIRARQMSEREKTRRADVVIRTGLGRRFVLCRLIRLLARVRSSGPVGKRGRKIHPYQRRRKSG